MTSTAWPIALADGGPTYTPQMLRRLLGVFLAKSTARPMGALNGIHPATPSGYITATSTTWTLVAPLTGVIDTQASAVEGAYGFEFDMTGDTGAVNAADATYQRVDSICIQISDPGASDGTASGGAALVYTAGIPGAAGGARGAAGGPPAVPARAYELVQITVPQSGGGAPSVTDVAPRMAAAGGIVKCLSTSSYPDSPYNGQVLSIFGRLLRYWGSAWQGVASVQQEIKGTSAYPPAVTAGNSHNVLSTSITTTGPATIEVDVTCPMFMNSGLAVAGNVHVKIGATEVRTLRFHSHTYVTSLQPGGTGKLWVAAAGTYAVTVSVSNDPSSGGSVQPFELGYAIREIA